MVQLELELDRSSDVPLYEQLQKRLSELIDQGYFEPGTKLPPSRELASALGVNRNTVTAAYDGLSTSGRVRSHVGRGTFVAHREPEAKDHMLFRFSRSAHAAAERVRPAPKVPEEHPDTIDFASLVPDEELFPVEPFRSVLDHVLRTEGKKLLQYGPAAGYPPLRHYIAERLRKRGVAAQPDNVLIVNGSQQALDLICRSLLDPGDRVVLESPTYTIVLPLLAQYQAQTVAIPMTARGVDLDALEAALDRDSRTRFVFTMPTFHNPTGITLDLPSRKRLLEVAARFRVPVVEHDFDFELRFDGAALPPLKALDERGSVLHIGTFSKGLFPGLRLGWIVADREVVAAIERSKLIADYYTSLLLQAAGLEFCLRGHYDRHLKRLAAIYRQKSQRLVRALERHFPDNVSWTTPEGGYAFWVTLPEGLSAESLLQDSVREGVIFTPGSHFFAAGGGESFLRLSISRVPVERIEEGVVRLGAALRRLGDQSGRGSSPSREQMPAFHI
ncbi:MAG TPA: PLP-dependent aminotransferase family protein [Vicinamibacteria bacterium]|nr:PLP-dependent aminotransferase family protein [Vicinamibacteria bacterium]